MDYDAQCKAAATAQGLDPVMEALRGKRAFELAQTGGFCMVVTVPYKNGTWGITNDGGYLAAWYPGDSWREGGEEGEAIHGISLEALVELVSKPGE